MASFKMNKMVDAASGKVGNMVFKQVGRRTLYTQAPEHLKPATENQTLQRERFKRAATYAKTVLLDPATKAAYEKSVAGQEFQHAFTAALKDYLKSPVVDSVNTIAYRGNTGDHIMLRVFDSFKVAQAVVTITAPDNTLIETGAAVQSPDSAEWVYVATNANAAVTGSKLAVAVTNKPGNITMFDKVL